MVADWVSASACSRRTRRREQLLPPAIDGEGLPRTRLAVGKDAHIVAVEGGLHQVLGVLEHRLLRRVGAGREGRAPQGEGRRVRGVGIGAHGSGCRVWGVGCGVQGVGCRV